MKSIVLLAATLLNVIPAMAQTPSTEPKVILNCDSGGIADRRVTFQVLQTPEGTYQAKVEKGFFGGTWQSGMQTVAYENKTASSDNLNIKIERISFSAVAGGLNWSISGQFVDVSGASVKLDPTEVGCMIRAE